LQQEKNYCWQIGRQKDVGKSEGAKQQPTTKVDGDTILGGIQSAGRSAVAVVELKIAS